MANRIRSFSTRRRAEIAMKRLLALHPVHPDCKVEVVGSPDWNHPFRFLIAVTGKDGRTAFWSTAK